MARLQRLVRRAVLAKLKGDAGLLALVPANAMNPVAVAGTEPKWPFMRLDAPVTRRFRAACAERSGIVAVDIHAFAKSRYSATGAVIETAEDHASQIGEAIETALADQHLTLEGGADAHVSLNDIRLLQDSEPDAFHWFAQITARVLSA
jgi:hypothetical protein